MSEETNDSQGLVKKDSKKVGLVAQKPKGTSCLDCGKKCPGLSVHPWRKRCTNCFCSTDRHLVLEKGEKRDLKKGKPQPGESFKYTWQPKEMEMQEMIKFMESLPKDYIPRVGSKGAQKRQELIAKQRPSHDFEVERCHPLSKLEKERFLKFFKKREGDQGEVSIAKVEYGAPIDACANCGIDVMHGEYYLSTEIGHAGPNKMWHPKCFCCTNCKEFIADLKYFFWSEDDAIYCGRCHASIQYKRCYGCDELIFNDTFTEALGYYWHGEHFCCWYCDNQLGGLKFIQVNDRVVSCVKCYNSKDADNCDICGKPISVGEKKLGASGRYWHATCFACYLCGTPLRDKAFYKEQGKVFCGQCIVGGLAQCSTCDGIISSKDTYVQYQSHRWHSNCFKCCKCSMPLSGEEFVLKDKKIRCRECYRSKSSSGITRCVSCKKEIKGKGLMFKSKPYHPSCLSCSHCEKTLTEETPNCHEDKPFCKECYIKLFSSRCTKCVKPITGKYTIYKGHPFHKDCFVCIRCSKQISNNEFYESQHGDFFCETCAAYA